MEEGAEVMVRERGRAHGPQGARSVALGVMVDILRMRRESPHCQVVFVVAWERLAVPLRPRLLLLDRAHGGLRRQRAGIVVFRHGLCPL